MGSHRVRHPRLQKVKPMQAYIVSECALWARRAGSLLPCLRAREVLKIEGDCSPMALSSRVPGDAMPRRTLQCCKLASALIQGSAGENEMGWKVQG